VNLTVWTDVANLRAFAYRGPHAEFFRRRREWFEPMDEHLVLWWITTGHQPSLREASQRIAALRANGPTPTAFTLRTVLPTVWPSGVHSVRTTRTTRQWR